MFQALDPYLSTASCTALVVYAALGAITIGLGTVRGRQPDRPHPGRPPRLTGHTLMSAVTTSVGTARTAFDAALHAEVARGRQELRALEWSVPVPGREPSCSCCGGWQRVGHAASCRLGAIIRAVS